jgi:hypothetical protein
MVMGSCEIRFGQKQDYHVLNPLPSLYPNQLAETKEEGTVGYQKDVEGAERTDAFTGKQKSGVGESVGRE